MVVPGADRIQPSFVGVAKHYGVGVDPCPPRHPQRKGVVEKAIHYISQRWWRTAMVGLDASMISKSSVLSTRLSGSVGEPNSLLSPNKEEQKMSEDQVIVYAGVDTHRDVHVAAVVDTAGRVLATSPFPTDETGYEQLKQWLRSQGHIARVGVEGTGSYGAGLARYLTEMNIKVLEVNRPNRQLRRRLGKTDTVGRHSRRAGCSQRRSHRPTQNRGRTGRGDKNATSGPSFGGQSPYPGHQPTPRPGGNRS